MKFFFYSSGAKRLINCGIVLGICRGYVAPEYVTRGQLTEKVDAYSYGVVLMEIVTGEVNMKRTPSGALLFLVDRVSHLHLSRIPCCQLPVRVSSTKSMRVSLL